MVHIGNTPASNFASVTKDTFSGDGSTTAFTLSKAATTNGVAVYVENVRQIPTTAYTVSGTTLDFGSGNAPVSLSQPFATGAPLPMDTTGMPQEVANAVTRDYSSLMKAIDKKKGK